jgi:RsiW-degrading membrane proteinase PrsW (M82 family)
MTVAETHTRGSAALRHLLLPALAPIAIVGLYFTPVSLIGCANRGLLALAVAAISTVAAFVCVAFAFRARSRSDPAGLWWAVSALVLTLPLALLLGPLG